MKFILNKKKNRDFGMAFAIILFSVSVIIFTLMTINAFSQVASKPVSLTINTGKPLIIIDAGHGGEDGGAVSNNICEKELNLSIAGKLNDIFAANGYTTLMTRDEDISLSDEGLSTVKERKTSDIKKRLETIENNPGCIFISIHQNKFSQEKYNGTQVFYSTKNENSKKLAQSIQNSVTNQLQPDNRREIKPSNKSIYILNNTTQTAVLIECGFISNKSEAEKLKDEEYQNQLSTAIYTAVEEYLTQI